MKRLLILIYCTALLACSKTGRTLSDNFLKIAPPPTHPAEQDAGSLVTRDVTDRSACQGPAPLNSSLAGQAWKLNYSFSNGATVDQYIFFDEHFMVVENNCRWQNQTKTARVKVPIRITEGEFEIQSGDSSQETIPGGDEEFYCIADVPTDIVKFSFVGNCLSFDFSAGSIVLAPAP